MTRRQRRSSLVLTVFGVSASVSSVHGTVYSWSGNGTDNNWADTNNWLPSGYPTSSSDQAVFNGAGNSQTTVSLGGAQTTGSIEFDSGASAYFIGGMGDTLNLSGSGTLINMTGGAAEEIDSSITLSGSGTFANTSSLGLTLGTSSFAGVITVPGSNTLFLDPTGGGTITINSSIQGAAANVTWASGAKGAVVFGGSSTYGGTTTQASNNTLTIQVASSTDTTSSATYTEGPFGKSTILFNVGGANGNSPVQALNAAQVIANPISIGNGGFTITNASTPYNLSFDGPITHVGNGRTLTINTPGQTFTLGASPNSTTLGLGNTGATITGSGATVVVNDTIVDFNSSTHSALTYNMTSTSPSTLTYVITGSNTYSGGTTFANTSAQFAVDIESDSSADGTTGPFGSATLTFSSSLPAILEPVGADRTIANPILLNSHGFFAYTFGSDKRNLTLTGPIYEKGGISTNNMIAGTVLNLGSQAAPSFIAGINAGFAIQGQFASGDTTNIYDNIVNGSSVVGQTGTGSLLVKATAAGDVAVVNLYGSNSYTGGSQIQTGAVVTTYTNFSNGALTLTNGVAGGAKAVVAVENTGPGVTSRVTQVPSLSIDGGTPSSSQLDITNNGLIVQSGTSFSTVQTDIVDGAASGFTGPGITSSLAAAVAADGSNPNKTAIGYASVSDLGNPGWFLGVTITDSNSTLVRYTLAGDSNLDGIVNALDFNALATHYGTMGGADWVQGDYNYDGNVDSNDFDLLAANFGGNITTAATSAQPLAALGSVVPEPTSLTLLGMSIVALRRRRRTC